MDLVGQYWQQFGIYWQYWHTGLSIITDIGPVLVNPYMRSGRVPIIYNIGPVLAKQLVTTMVTCMSGNILAPIGKTVHLCIQ